MRKEYCYIVTRILKFSREKGTDIEIRDGERPLKIGQKYEIIAHEFALGNYGDDLVVTDYEIEELTA